MEKYRIISRWTSDYYPKGYRQDGKPQERVEELGILSEEEAKYTLEYFNKHLADGAWIADRYEIDDEKYKCFELILPQQYVPAKTEEPTVIIKLEAETNKNESSELINPEKKKRNKIQRIDIFKPKEELVISKTEEIFGPTKTIYVTKYIATQRNLGPNVQKINGRIPSEERIKIYKDFNNNLSGEMSITEAVARLGGVRYETNGKEINVVFLDDIDFHAQEFILGKINKKF